MTLLTAFENDLLTAGARPVLSPLDMTVLHANTLEAALTTARNAQPDAIIFSDGIHPNTDAVILTMSFRDAAPLAKLIIIGRAQNGLLIRELMQMGVSAYLYWYDDLRDGLRQAVSFALKDRPYLSPTANAEYLTTLQASKVSWQFDAESLAVLRMLIKGQHVDEIARTLDISKRRVYWLRQRLRRRFGVNTNEHLVARALEEGFAGSE